MKALLLFLAALAAGLSYPLSWSLDLAPAYAIAWKGAGVGLLAVWASAQGRTPSHRLLAAVLTLGAVADMVLEVHFILGAAIFAVGHVVAITLYLRNRRPTPFAGVTVPLLIIGSLALAATLAPADMRVAVAVYTLFLAGMAATAGLSRFPLAATGAMAFLASDLLIFARMTTPAEAAWADLAIWLLYFGGQALIAWGVASVVRYTNLRSSADRAKDRATDRAPRLHP